MSSDITKNLLERLVLAVERIAASIERISGYTQPKFTDIEIPAQSIITQPLPDLDDPVNSIHHHIMQNGIVVRSFRTDAIEDTKVNQMTWYMGERFESIEPFLATLKRHINGAEFRFSMANFHQRQISDVCQFSTIAHTLGFLARYQYHSKQRTIVGCVTAIPKVQNFFNGLWFERYIVQKINNIINLYEQHVQQRLNIVMLENVIIVLSNGDQHEIDLLVSVNDEIYYFEAKTGDIDGSFYQKYIKIAGFLDIPKERIIVVRARTTVSEARNQGILVCSIGVFEQRMRSVFDRHTR
jgi:hypothetical protein